MRRYFTILIATAVALTGIFAFGHRTEVTRTNSPDGRYQAVTTVSSWRQFIPLAPGQSSDQPCRVEIINEKGVSMGELCVEMIQQANVEWVPDGAQIQLVGGWDFMKGLCWQGSRAHSYSYVRGHAP